MHPSKSTDELLTPMQVLTSAMILQSMNVAAPTSVRYNALFRAVVRESHSTILLLDILAVCAYTYNSPFIKAFDTERESALISTTPFLSALPKVPPVIFNAPIFNAYIKLVAFEVVV